MTLSGRLRSIPPLGRWGIGVQVLGSLFVVIGTVFSAFLYLVGLIALAPGSVIVAGLLDRIFAVRSVKWRLLWEEWSDILYLPMVIIVNIVLLALTRWLWRKRVHSAAGRPK